jgi:hypothetical protein
MARLKVGTVRLQVGGPWKRVRRLTSVFKRRGLDSALQILRQGFSV